MTLKQLCEMNDKAKKLVELMKQGIVKFIYRKKSTGKIRKAEGTLKRDLIPPEAQRKRGRPKKRPDDLVIYYDVGKKAIRSFKDELLQRFDKTAKVPEKDINSKKKLSEEDKSDAPKRQRKTRKCKISA